MAKAVKLYHDIETRSPVDLKACGQYVYAAHPLTEIIIWSWAINDDTIKTWYPFFNEPIPRELEQALFDPDVILCAHNSSFERILESMAPVRKQKLLSDEVVAALRPIERWHCTAAKAAAAGLPRTLDGAAKALGIPAQKDNDGYRIMLRTCKPHGLDDAGNYIWWAPPLNIRREGLYCERDVEPERQIDKALPDLSPFETKVWRHTERMNDRGIAVDAQLLTCLSNFVAEAEKELNNRLRVATCDLHQKDDHRKCINPEKCSMNCGNVPKVSNHLAIRKWLLAQGYSEVEETGIGKDIIVDMLESDTLSELVREVLTARQEGGKSSTAKYRGIINRLSSDSRIRGSTIYCGAAATGRFASRGSNLQNLNRGGVIETIIEAVDDILNGADTETVKLIHGAPLVVASEMLRPVFVASDSHWIARGDYSQIEARTLAWLGGQKNVLQAFADYDTILGLDDKGKPIRKGPDAYRIAGSGIYGIPPLDLSDTQRQVGKVAVLALGFAGGVGAFMKMAKKNKGVHITEEQAAVIRDAWRESNPDTVKLWHNMESAAIKCMKGGPGTRADVRPGMWFARGQRILALRLPSGSVLTYWYPKLVKKQFPWGERDSIICYSEDPVSKQFIRKDYYGGIYAQNATQRLARDIMAYALVSLGEKGLNPVLSVHDEVLCELPKSLYPTPEMAANAVRDTMLIKDDWAREIPVSVDASAGPRYIKA